MSAKTIVLCVFLGHVGVWLASADLYQTRDDQETTVIFTFDVNASTIETTVAVNEQSSLPTETTRSNSSFTSEVQPNMALVAPLLFSIVSFTIRSSSVPNSYTVDVLLNSTCASKRDWNATLIFRSSPSDETKVCSPPARPPGIMTCDNFIYGVRYTVGGFLTCGARDVSLSPSRELYEMAKPRYLNATSSSTSIDTQFFLPGFFDQLVVELSTVNRTCSVGYSSYSSPWYHCLFENLPPAQWFVLTYYTKSDRQQASSSEVTIVHTDLEELDFRCELDGNHRQIDFHWTSLTGSGYSNLTISVSIDEKKQLWTIICDPYASRELCSTKAHRLEPGREYHAVIKLRKNLPNYNGQKTGTCSVRTNLSSIDTHSIRHQFLTDSRVRISWPEHPFHVDARLRNVETNIFISPLDNTRQMATFANLTEASIFQLELNISKANWSPILQHTQYLVQTDLRKPMIESVQRPSEKSLIIHLQHYHTSKIKFTYCLQPLIDDSLPMCASSNIFNQLLAGTIYNLSVSIHRDSFQNKFTWERRTVCKLVSTNPPVARIRSWNNDDSCAAELRNPFPMEFTPKCISNGRTSNCAELACGCRHQLQLVFNQSYISALCSTTDCDIPFNDPNGSATSFQTPLAPVRNLRIVSVSPALRQIEVDYDHPRGCFEQLLLVCEMTSSKQRRASLNATICTDLVAEAFYRIHVETKRTGWETVASPTIETQLIFIPPNHDASQHRGSFVQSVLIPGMIAMLIIIALIFLAALTFVYRQRRRKHSKKRDSVQITSISSRVTTTKLSNILNQVNIYPNGKRNHSKDLKRAIFTSRPIRIKDIPFEYEQLIANNYYSISDEFHKLRHSLDEVPELTQVDQLYKNRYKDIVPYEHSRVKLIPVDEGDSGYINASFITGLHNPREYIACQGPLKSTISDHWQMIWEQNVTIIVMLTELIERGMNKCEQYWPTELHEAELFGDISVCVTGCVSMPSYDLRHMELIRNDEVRSIKHYAFKMWNDHTVPTNGDILVDFIRLIRSEYRPECQGPILVHCSAGVGRSGTFIALDRLLQQFDKVSSYGHLDIYGTVLEMRRCRDKMVQNEHQYLFIYRCLKEEFEKRSGNTNNAVVADDCV